LPAGAGHSPGFRFRHAGTRFEDVVTGLETRFISLGDRVEAVWNGSRYYLHTSLPTMHTTCSVEQDATGAAEMVASGRATLRILRRKLLRNIEEAKRVFVFVSLNPQFGETQIRRLHGASCRAGAAAVRPAGWGGRYDRRGRADGGRALRGRDQCVC
jgi:hypothetical protein